MRITTLKTIVFIFCISCLLSGCKKKEIKGPQGDPGTPGNGGNANISSTNEFVVATTQWTSDVAETLWRVSILSPLITKEVGDNGSVKVFIKVNTGWWELPYSDDDLFTQFGFEEGKINMTHSDIHGGSLPRPVTATYRLVVFSKSARPQTPSSPLSNNTIANTSTN